MTLTTAPRRDNFRVNWFDITANSRTASSEKPRAAGGDDLIVADAVHHVLLLRVVWPPALRRRRPRRDSRRQRRQAGEVPAASGSVSSVLRVTVVPSVFRVVSTSGDSR
jgi:hypothetical protein